MAINYIPPEKDVRDFRKSGNGHYEATCEYCGTAFYPKRRGVRYCTHKCNNMHASMLRSVPKGLKTPSKEAPAASVDVPLEEYLKEQKQVAAKMFQNGGKI